MWKKFCCSRVYLLNRFVTSGTYYVPLTERFFKSTGKTVSHFFSMLPSILKYLCSVETVRIHFSAKQPCTNDTVCNAALQHCTQYHLYTGKCILTGSTDQRYFKIDGSIEKKWDTVIPADLKRLFVSGT
jgi:hypothetical protein